MLPLSSDERFIHLMLRLGVAVERSWRGPGSGFSDSPPSGRGRGVLLILKEFTSDLRGGKLPLRCLGRGVGSGGSRSATTPTTPPAPTCYADSAARRMPALRTRKPSSWLATPPRSRTSLAGATSLRARPACDIDRHRRQSAQATGRTRTRPLKPSKLRRRWRQSFGRRSRQAQRNAVIGQADLQLCRCRKRVHLQHSDAKGRGTARTVEGC
jgi:hypothetical protein